VDVESTQEETMKSTGILFSKRSGIVFFPTTLLTGAVLMTGLLAANAGVATAPTVEIESVELPPEWRMKPKLMRFDHMFRKSAPKYERNDWIRDPSHR
jgi:hypothetical protein